MQIIPVPRIAGVGTHLLKLNHRVSSFAISFFIKYLIYSTLFFSVLRNVPKGLVLNTGPIRASQADLETLPHVYDLVLTAKDFNEKLLSKAIISCAPTNPQINEIKGAQILLSDFSDHLGLVNTFIRERKVYRDALLEGKGVVEMNNIKASIEFRKFVDEILEVENE
jgi:hypothetical protein